MIGNNSTAHDTTQESACCNSAFLTEESDDVVALRDFMPSGILVDETRYAREIGEEFAGQFVYIIVHPTGNAGEAIRAAALAPIILEYGAADCKVIALPEWRIEESLHNYLQTLPASLAKPSSFAAWLATWETGWSKGRRDEQDDQAKAASQPTHEETAPLLIPISPRELQDRHPNLREPILDGILRRTEIINLIAPSKTGKSWLSLGLALSVAAGRAWMGRFPVRPGRVLLVDNELHPETIASRLRWVATAMGLDAGDYDETLAIQPLRGNLCDLLTLEPYFASLAGRFDLIILDAMYRFWWPGFDENSNADVTRLYNHLDAYAQTTGAAFAMVHHSSKGTQEGKATTDVGAGAGSMGRACDAHLALRTDPMLGADYLTVDAAVRSFPPMEPFVIRRQHPLWTVDGNASRAVDGKPEKLTSAVFAERYADTTPRTKKEVTGRAIDDGYSIRIAETMLESAISDGCLYPWKIAGEAHKRYATCKQPMNEDADDPVPF